MGRKTTVWILQATKCWYYIHEDLDIAEKGNSQEETESLLIAAQNNAIKTNYIKAKIDNTQASIM